MARLLRLSGIALLATLLVALVSTAEADGGFIIRTVAPELDHFTRRGDQKRPPTPASLELEKASTSFEKQDYDGCFALLESAAKMQPELPPPRLMLARLYLAKGAVREARALLEQAAVESPEYPGVYLTFGNLALKEDRVADATLHFEKALPLIENGRWPEGQRRGLALQAHGGLSTIAARRSDWPAAHQQLLKMLEVADDKAAIRQRLAQALVELGDEGRAFEQLRTAVAEDSELERPELTMGKLYARHDNADQAAKWMARAVEVAPEQVRVQLAYGEWLFQQQHFDKAQRHADLAAALDPKSYPAQMLRGSVAMYRGDYPSAEKQFQKVLQDSPADFPAGNLLALALIEQSDDARKDRALQLAQVNARQYPRSPEALATLGWVLYRLGRRDEAERMLRVAVADGKASADAAWFLARVHLDRGQSKDARKLLEFCNSSRGAFRFRNEAQQALSQLPAENKE